MKEHFEKETYMCMVNEQDSQFPESHWLMVYQNKKNTYFQALLEVTLPTDLFTKYLVDCNVQTRNYVELVLYFLGAGWQKYQIQTALWITLHGISD